VNNDPFRPLVSRSREAKADIGAGAHSWLHHPGNLSLLKSRGGWIQDFLAIPEQTAKPLTGQA
jgi:hypothetical protein